MNLVSLEQRLSDVQDLDSIAITDMTDAISYRQLVARVNDIAQWLSKHAVRTLALHADNSIDWVLVDLACQQAQIVSIPLPDFFSQDQLDGCLSNSEVDLVLSSSTSWITQLLRKPGSLELIHDVPIALRAIRVAGESGSDSLNLPQQNLPIGTQKVTFTSGSTGSPKGVCLSADHQWQTAQALASAIDIEQPIHLCLLPLATLLENVAGIYAPLLRGGTVVVPSGTDRGLSGSSGVDVNSLLDCLSRVEPNTVILLPQLLTVLIAACDQGWTPPKSLQFIAVGGAKVAPELLQQAEQHGLPVYQGYGLSECGSVVALNTPQNNTLGKVGKRLAHCEIRVERGQIVLSKPLFLGYQGESGSWYPKAVYTGDIGELEDDYLSVNGRQKNLIISSFGRNIHPEWVESELLAKPLLSQCVVVGENRPHLIAILSAPASVSDTQVAAWVTLVNERLPDYAQVRGWKRLPIEAWKPLLTANGRPQRQSISHHLVAEIDAVYRSIDGSPACSQLSIVESTNMKFFDQLKAETQAAQAYLLNAPIMQRAMQGDVTRHDYGAFLLQAYHHVKHTTPLLMAAGSRIPSSKEWLRDALAEYIEEELGHQEWILNDLAKCGYNKETARRSTPNRSTELMVAYAYDMINRINPVGFFGMIHVLEGTSVTMADNAANSIQNALGLPKAAFSYLRSHGALDQEHIQFFESLMNRIDDPADQAQIIHCANMFYHLYGDIFRELDASQVLTIAA